MSRKINKKGPIESDNTDPYQTLAKYRHNTLKINQFLSQEDLDKDKLKELKKLLLEDALDRLDEEIPSSEWQEILEERVVVCPSRKELSLLAQMLCLV